MRPDEIVPALLASDPARPRITFYDDTPGPTAGERIELSGKVLANWVNKAANLLQEEFDAEPGFTVRLDLPPQHWRTAYWALATWAVGATLVVGTGNDDLDLLVTDDAAKDGPDTIVVTLAALARNATRPVSQGLDEARVLATYGDQFGAWQRANDDDVALRSGDDTFSYADLVGETTPGERRLLTGAPGPSLRRMAATLAADGSLVMVRGSSAVDRDRLAREGVTAGM